MPLIEFEFICKTAVSTKPWETQCGCYIRGQRCTGSSGFITHWYHDNRGTLCTRDTWVCEKHAKSFAKKHGIEIQPAELPAKNPADQGARRTIRRRVGQVTVEELRLLFDWSLPGHRPYGLSQADRFYIVARVVVETDEPVYPCRPSEYRRVSEVEVYRVKPKIVKAVVQRLKHVEEREAWRKYQDYLTLKDLEPEAFYEGFFQLSAEERESVGRIWKRIWRRAGSSSGTGRHNWEHVPTAPYPKSPCWDKSKCTYPTGRFTTWLRTDEIRHALGHGRLIKCHDPFLTLFNAGQQRLWRKVRNEVLRRYGRICMRCGRATGEMHIDHIKPWAQFPEQRYDPENLQVLCRDCHAWKAGTDMDFRPDAPDT